MKNVVLLGSTGSIGTSAIKVAEDLPDRIRLIGLAAGGNAELLVKQTLKHRPEAFPSTTGESARVGNHAGNHDPRLFRQARVGETRHVACGGHCAHRDCRTAGLQPALAAIRAGKDIAVASKEILVMAGETVMSEARNHGVRVLAVDSEHSAVFQCLDGKPASSVRKLWLTASGGLFARHRERTFKHHPRARVETSVVGDGRKITIDSATLFNKGSR